MKHRKSTQPFRTLLTISTGFLVIYLITKLPWTIWISVLVGVCGVISKPLSTKIEWAWMKLGGLLSLVIPPMIMSLTYFVVLWPLALLRKIFGRNDSIQLKNQGDSLFKKVNKEYRQEDLEKPW